MPPDNEDYDPAQQENPLLTEPEITIAPGEVEAPPVAVEGRRAAAVFIFLTVALDMLALGMIAPVLPRLIEGFLSGSAVSAAQILGIFGTLFAGMQFCFSPVLGSLSDRFGRRPVVLLSNFGMGLDYLLMAWAPALGWLFVGRIISGLTASSIPTAMAYMADVTPREKRAAAFGILNAAFGVGFVLGPAVGGLLGQANPRLPFWVASALSMLNGMYGLFVLPESLPREHRTSFSWKRANPIGSLSLLSRRRSLLTLASLLLIGQVAQQSLMNVYVIYADYRYHWTDRTVGLSLAAVGLCAGLYGALLVKRVVAKLGERKTIFLGLPCGAMGFCMFGLSKTGLLFWLGIPVMNVMSFVWPSVQSLMSHEVGPSEQGQLQGAINSMRGISGLIGPGLFTYIFSKTIAENALIRQPGMPFFVAGGMLLIALMFAPFATGRAEQR